MSEQEAENNLFKSSVTAARQEQLSRRSGLQRFSVNEASATPVTVLAQETQPSPMPLAVKFQRGSGTVYHVVADHLFTQVREYSNKIIYYFFWLAKLAITSNYI